MAQNITVAGASYSAVPAVKLPKTGGGTASFTDVSDTTATASDVINSKYFYAADGTRTQGTGSGGITPTGNINITQSGETDVTNYATATVPSAEFFDQYPISFSNAQWDFEVGSNGIVNTTFQSWGDLTDFVTTDGYATTSDSLSAYIYVSGEYQLSTQSATTITPSTSAQTAVAAGKYTTGAVTVAAMPSGTVTAPASITGSSATVSTGTNTLTLSKTVSVTPSVTTAGYVSSGTAGNSSVSLTASVTTQAAQTIHPSTSDQSITSGKYLTGNQTIKGVLLTNLSAGNIKKDVVVKIGDSTDDDCVTSITGTYEGSGGGGGSTKLVQGTFTTNSSSGAQTITIPYTGSGYPISASIYIDGGMRDSTTSFPTLVDRYAVGVVSLSKAVIGSTPTYTTSGSQNQGIVSYVYKNSASAADSYGASAQSTANTYSSSASASGAATMLRFTSKTNMSIYVKGTSYGFAKSTTYHYDIVYSS